MKLTMDIIHAFTDQPFKGNPAGVIITKEWLSDELMQTIATENRLSETAYLVQTDDNEYHIRWFSPRAEVDFCGHATLASASVIFAQSNNSNDNTTSNCELKSIIICADAVGNMTITRQDDGSIAMDFPNRKPSLVADIPDDVLQCLSIKPSAVLLNNQAYFAIYDTEQEVLDLISDVEQLKKIAPYEIVATAPSTQSSTQSATQSSSDYDFVSRYFWADTPDGEDPVTGSAHTGLAPYWAEKLNKTTLRAYQASQRGGYLLCSVTDERVQVIGHAVHYSHSVINISSYGGE